MGVLSQNQVEIIARIKDYLDLIFTDVREGTYITKNVLGTINIIRDLLNVLYEEED